MLRVDALHLEVFHCSVCMYVHNKARVLNLNVQSLGGVQVTYKLKMQISGLCTCTHACTCM